MSEEREQKEKEMLKLYGKDMVSSSVTGSALPPQKSEEKKENSSAALGLMINAL